MRIEAYVKRKNIKTVSEVIGGARELEADRLCKPKPWSILELESGDGKSDFLALYSFFFSLSSDRATLRTPFLGYLLRSCRGRPKGQRRNVGELLALLGAFQFTFCLVSFTFEGELPPQQRIHVAPFACDPREATENHMQQDGTSTLHSIRSRIPHGCIPQRIGPNIES